MKHGAYKHRVRTIINHPNYSLPVITVVVITVLHSVGTIRHMMELNMRSEADGW